MNKPKNPYSPVTEPASWKWFDEKPSLPQKPKLEKIRLEIDTRSNFASKQYYKLMKSFNPQSDGIAGRKARKIAQAYNIFKYYQQQFCIDMNIVSNG